MLDTQSEWVVAYKVRDKYNNTFTMNFSNDYNDEYNEFTCIVSVGARLGQPCVQLRTVYTKGEQPTHLDILDLVYHKLCSFHDLPQGEYGTQSMLLCSLEMTLRVFPSLKIFSLQDNSHKKNEHGGTTCLSDYSMLTKGKTWYQTFLPVQFIGSATYENSIKRLQKRLSQVMNVSYDNLSAVYGHTSALYKLYSECVGLCTWIAFHTKLFTSTTLVNQTYLENILLYHGQFKSLFEQSFQGNIADVPSGNILSAEKEKGNNVLHAGGGKGKLFYYKPSPPLFMYTTPRVFTDEELN